ncbi:MAG: hypothetical protein WBA92_04840, partial [Pseudorhodobacter sp.]
GRGRGRREKRMVELYDVHPFGQTDGQRPQGVEIGHSQSKRGTVRQGYAVPDLDVLAEEAK